MNSQNDLLHTNFISELMENDWHMSMKNIVIRCSAKKKCVGNAQHLGLMPIIHYPLRQSKQLKERRKKFINKLKKSPNVKGIWQRNYRKQLIIQWYVNLTRFFNDSLLFKLSEFYSDFFFFFTDNKM